MIANDFISDGGRHSIQKSPLYLGCLVLAKIVRTVGVFIVSDLLKLVHVVQLLFLMKIFCAVPLIILQRPFSRGRKLGHRAMRTILQHSVLSCAVQVLWFYGITLCGAFRSVLLFENSPLVVATSLRVLFKSNGSPSKMRGALIFFCGYLSCILIDRDSSIPHAHSETHSHHSGLNHIFYHIIHWFGLADHKGGVLVMLIAMLLHTALDVFGRHAATEVGGAKRLHAASTFVSVILLTPWAIWTAFSQTIMISSWSQFVFLACVGSMILFLVDFYLDSFCHSRLDASVTSRVVPIVMFLTALALTAQYLFTMDFGNAEPYPIDVDLAPAEHGISGGSIFTMVLFICATFIQTAPSAPKSRTGQFIGYSNSGLPLYVYGEDLFHRTSHSISLFVKNTLKQVLSSSDSRRIFYFLCANLTFTFVEFLYGFWTNSLGLISDGFHMMFDCSALVMGLVASVMSTWPSTRVFSYGYGRVETLSGFINGLFLLTVSFFIFIEAIERAFDPPDIVTEKLLPVSVAGLVVNLFGIFVFSDAHGHSHGGGGGHSHAPAVASPAGGHGHSHGGQHGHSHGDAGAHHHGDAHGHSHDDGLMSVVTESHPAEHGHSHASSPPKAQFHGHSHGNANMEGVFLHVLADTLGSVAVIVSTLLIKYFGWLVADPICSLMVAMLIFASVLPLLKNAAKILLQRLPPEMEDSFVDALAKILQVEGVISYSRPHLWQQKPESYVATVHVQITEESHQQRIIQQVSQLLRNSGVKNVTVQVEKNSFYQYMTGLSGSFQMPSRISRMPLQQSLMVQAI